jgi:hypothetical protein
MAAVVRATFEASDRADWRQACEVALDQLCDIYEPTGRAPVPGFDREAFKFECRPAVTV